MSWGDNKWGETPWGGQPAAPTPPTLFAEVTEVDIIGEKLISVTFDRMMKNGTQLKLKTNYTVTPSGTGNTVVVEGILSGTEVQTNSVILVVTRMTVGETYTVEANNVFSAAGEIIDITKNSSTLVSRLTKHDFIHGDKPSMYDKSPDSILSSILAAISLEDDKIGGNK